MGYQFSVTESHSCAVCNGTGVATETFSLTEPDSSGYIGRAISWARQYVPAVESERTCETCGGDGEIVETRPRTVDELTDRQIRFLHTAQMEREKAKWGDGDSGSSSAPTTPQQQVSKPSMSGPPVRGGARKM